MEQKVSEIEKSLAEISTSISNFKEQQKQNHEIMLKILDSVSDTKTLALKIENLNDNVKGSLDRVHTRVDRNKVEVEEVVNLSHKMDKDMSTMRTEILQLQKDNEANKSHKLWLVLAIIGSFVSALSKFVFK